MLLLVSTMFKLRLICTSAYFAINHWSRGQQALNLTQSSQGFAPLVSLQPPCPACGRLVGMVGPRHWHPSAPPARSADDWRGRLGRATGIYPRHCYLSAPRVRPAGD